MIRAENLSFAYDTAKVLDGISFDIGKGQLTAVLGPNGAGKSTLLKCLLGLLKNYNGDIWLDEQNIKTLDRKKMAAIAAYVPQSEAPVFNYTVMDTVLMGTAGALSPLQMPGEAQTSAAKHAIDLLGIEHLSGRGIREISGGERQLALLARAIAQRAGILIMDEPTANLDYGNQQLVLRHIQDMAKKGYTIMLSTHNPEHALQYATHVLAVKNNKILAQGSVDDVLDEQLIKELYGLEVRIIEIETKSGRIRSCIPAAL